jgi:leader peptidase (prepilin peptidase)/N-methyltransferase
VSIHDSRLILWYCCCVAAVLGAVMGSFLNCAAWRIAHGQNFLKGRSHCPECGHVLSVGDLVPVFSWLFLRGKCRYCGAKVSVRYLLAELFMAAVTVVCLLRYDLTVLCLRNYIFLCCLFCLSLVDLEDYTIPDGCLLVSAAVWLLALPFLHMSWKESLLHLLAALVFGGGLLLLSLAMDRILKKDTLGGGDIKLYFVVGLYLGFAATLFSLLAACILGLLFAFLRKRFGKAGSELIPFGPSIAAAAAVMLLFGDPMVRWYLGLISAA